MKKQKPKIKYQSGQWMCGGINVSPWYVDWFIGETPTDAYSFWKRSQ